MSLATLARMSFGENALLWACAILFLLLVSYIGRYGSLPRFWNPWPADFLKALSEEQAVLYSLGGAPGMPLMSPLSAHTVLGTVPLQSTAERQTVIQQLRHAGSFRRLPAKVIFIPKYGLRVQHQGVVWEILFNELQAVCLRDAQPGSLFWIDLRRDSLDLLLQRHGVPLPHIA